MHRIIYGCAATALTIIVGGGSAWAQGAQMQTTSPTGVSPPAGYVAVTDAPPGRGVGLAPLRRARRWPPLAMAGGLVAAAAVALVVLIPAQEMRRAASEVAEVHARARDTGRWVETASDDPSAVARWLEPRVQYPLPPFPTGDGFALRGARVEALQGAPVATAVYEVRQHVVDVFAWPSHEGDSEPIPTVTGPWTVCRWAHAGVAYWMVSDAGSDDLKRLAGFLKAQRT